MNCHDFCQWSYLEYFLISHYVPEQCTIVVSPHPSSYCSKKEQKFSLNYNKAKVTAFKNPFVYPIHSFICSLFYSLCSWWLVVWVLTNKQNGWAKLEPPKKKQYKTRLGAQNVSVHKLKKNVVVNLNKFIIFVRRSSTTEKRHSFFSSTPFGYFKMNYYRYRRPTTHCWAVFVPTGLQKA